MLAAVVLASGLGRRAVAAVEPAEVVFRGPATSRTIALTFDDGWSSERCEAIHDILVRHRVPATWFPNAVYVRASPASWRRIAARFPIANHTARHRSLTGLKAGEIRREIRSSERIIESITGRPLSRILRPPYGEYDGRVLRQARRLGYDVVAMWDVSAGDTSLRTSDRRVAQHALRGRAGSVILLHCGPAVTPRILPIVIARYACLGFRFATLEGLLAGRRGVRARVTCPPPPLPEPSRRSPERRSERVPDDRSTGAAAPTVDLADRDWRLVAAAGNDELRPVGDEDVVTVRFGRRTASGLVGCDRFVVPVSFGVDRSLTFGRLARSDEGCPDAETQPIDDHLETLAAATSYRLRGDDLTLLDAEGRVRLHFRSSGPVGLVGDWAVSAVASEEGILQAPAAGQAVTATFTATGTVRGSTGCDSFVGGYSSRADAVAIGPLLSGPGACDLALGQQHRHTLGALRSAQTWQVRGSTLELRDAQGALVMVLLPRTAPATIEPADPGS